MRRTADAPTPQQKGTPTEIWRTSGSRQGMGLQQLRGCEWCRTDLRGCSSTPGADGGSMGNNERGTRGRGRKRFERDKEQCKRGNQGQPKQYTMQWRIAARNSREGVLDFLEIYCDTSPICEREPAMLARQARTNFLPQARTEERSPTRATTTDGKQHQPPRRRKIPSA